MPKGIFLRTKKHGEAISKSRMGHGVTKETREKISKSNIGKHSTHGLTGLTQYSIWSAMMNRCYNENNNGYSSYGGRGIAVCYRWHDVSNFINDIDNLGYIKGLDMDRINTNGDYSPENVRFITHSDNMNNTRTNKFIEYLGETHTIAQWAKILGIKNATLWNRIVKLKQPLERALTSRLWNV